MSILPNLAHLRAEAPAAKIDRDRVSGCNAGAFLQNRTVRTAYNAVAARKHLEGAHRVERCRQPDKLLLFSLKQVPRGRRQPFTAVFQQHPLVLHVVHRALQHALFGKRIQLLP